MRLGARGSDSGLGTRGSGLGAPGSGLGLRGQARELGKALGCAYEEAARRSHGRVHAPVLSAAQKPPAPKTAPAPRTADGHADFSGIWT